MNFVVSSITASFIKPAFFGEHLKVDTIPLKIGGASLTLEQKIFKKEETIFIATVKVALISKGRAIRFPSLIKNAFSNWSE